MSISVTITNLTSAPLTINELYTTLGASGTATASTTILRSMAQLDSMNETKTLLYNNSISVSPVASTDNADIMSIPIEQHGAITGISTAAAAEVLTVVTFAKPFPTGTHPRVVATIDKSNALTSRSNVYVQAISATGCTISVVVTTTEAASTVDVDWVAVL